MTDEMRETAQEMADDWEIWVSEGDVILLSERLRQEVIRLSKVWAIERMCVQWNMSHETVRKMIKDCEVQA